MSKKILVVEDVEENRLLLEGILGDTYSLYMAENGKQALEILESEEKPVLIISDVSMPVMDGFEFLSIIKEDPSLRNIPFIFITGSATEKQSLLAGAVDYFSKPFEPHKIRLRVANHIELSSYRASLERMVEEKALELIATKETFLESMATMIEYRSMESGEHIQRCKKLTSILVNQLVKNPKHKRRFASINPRNIIRAAPLHDVGKIAVPDHILLKPGRLTPEEFTIIKEHTTKGAEMIALMMKENVNDEYLQHCYDIARHHHERWDGKGYPDGLAGEDIPFSARIVALVDVYDALVSKRCYKKGMSHEEAMVIIQKESGTHFDADIVGVMLEVEGTVKDLYAGKEKAEALFLR